MPGRLLPLVTNEIYHVYNRGINRQPTFTSKREYRRAIESIEFYRACKPPISLSRFLRLEDSKKNDIISILEKSKKLVEIYSYCLMPNHFHFLLKQIEDNGISRFLSNLQNSYTKFFNARNDKDGALFLDQFKTVRIETDEQLLHTSRYIHINPYEGYIVRSLSDLEHYPWSSLPQYLSVEQGFVNINFILSFFKETEGYKKFVFDQIDYKKKINTIEHLLLDYFN
ncbi:hypothetical protein C4577_07060 [Candidatus Parcubacteria bacterium]|nr:MAG: hypothetical protein C4577_07060 [Candidatus Parcubacteria bacterium]